MGNYIEGKTKTIKKCNWKCIYCSQPNSTNALIAVTASQGYGLIGTKKDDAIINVKNKVREEVYRRVSDVNEKHIIPQGVFPEGKCAHCGKTQPWTNANRYPILRLIAGFVIGVIMAAVVSHLLPQAIMEDVYGLFILFLTFILSVWAVSEGSGKIIQILISRKMAPFGDEYFPVLSDYEEEEKPRSFR